jgi:hypothetical protein
LSNIDRGALGRELLTCGRLGEEIQNP